VSPSLTAHRGAGVSTEFNLSTCPGCSLGGQVDKLVGALTLQARTS
jgi:hypothetical protein